MLLRMTILILCYNSYCDLDLWQLQDLASTMLELWNLMDTPIEEQRLFQNVTSNIAASESEITEANTLSLDFLNFVSKQLHPNLLGCSDMLVIGAQF